MHKLLNILSQALSILLHPMLMPCYGMLLFCFSGQPSITILPRVYIIISLVGTFILTFAIPFILLLFMWKKGYIDSLHIDNSKQRTTPYIYTLICFGFWCYFVGVILKMPAVWLIVAIGATVALLAVTIINRWWKISAHLTALGGLLGGVCSIALYYSAMPTTLIISLLIISLLLMCARLYLNAHTPWQVVCGYLLGIVLTFIPNLIVYHA